MDHLLHKTNLALGLLDTVQWESVGVRPEREGYDGDKPSME